MPVLDDSELAPVLKACQGKTLVDRRMRPSSGSCWTPGCHGSEVRGITLDTLDLNHELVIVTGKGHKTRRVYFVRGPPERWTATCGNGARTVARTRLPCSCRSVDRCHQTVSATCSPLMAGLKQLNPHRFRHTFAHDFLLAGG
ncbi:MAG: tyrosine-type recombinase/integrase [Jiangellaceae bacterium]|nr:tyrosine-type recombinase/integrase [Jiangellaceae bacterium]